MDYFLDAVYLCRCYLTLPSVSLQPFYLQQGRFRLTGSSRMWSPFPKNPTKMMLDSLDQYVSLLPVVSKVLERHLHQLLMDQLLSRNVLSDMQFEFRRDRSTIIPLLVATYQWHLSLQKWPVSSSTLQRLLSLCLTRHFSTGYIN